MKSCVTVYIYIYIYIYIDIWLKVFSHFLTSVHIFQIDRDTNIKKTLNHDNKAVSINTFTSI